MQEPSLPPSKRKVGETGTDNTDARPQKKKKREEKSNIDAIPKEYRVLDNLARLLEMNSSGCTAICLQNDKILISNNDFHVTTQYEKGKNEKVDLINEVMNYFSTVAKGETSQDKEEIFQKICLARVKGEAKGDMLLNEEDITNIVSHVLNNSNWRKIDIIESYPREQRQYVAAACEIINNLARDFKRVHAFLAEDKQSSFAQALRGGQKAPITTGDYGAISYSDYNLMHDQENPGYAILGIEREKGVHAELQMIDYLLFTRVLQNTKKQIYIGISKLCCHACGSILDLCNKQYHSIDTIFGESEEGKKENTANHKYTDILKARGYHGLKSNFVLPRFLYDEDTIDTYFGDYEKTILDSIKTNAGYYTDKSYTYPIANISDIDDALLETYKVFIYMDYEISKKIYKDKEASSLIKTLKEPPKKKRWRR